MPALTSRQTANLLRPKWASLLPFHPFQSRLSSSSSSSSSSTAMPELKKRAVAGSFIFKFPDDDLSRKPQVALFRRSGEVRTYQHKYAPIAGGVEPDDPSPLATAWRELREETTLTHTSLRLFRQGKPYSFVDSDIGREWTVNPFAFILKSTGGRGEAGIRLDWEHEGYGWFDPDAVDEEDGSLPGVPRLRESLRRVWFDIDLGKDAGGALATGLRALQEDHESGARQLASKALAIFADVVSRIDAADGGAESHVWWKNVRLAAWHLWKNGRESMGAPILSVGLSSLAIVEEKLRAAGSGPLPAGFVDDVVGAIQGLARTRQQQQQSARKIEHAFASFLKQHFAAAQTVKILTLSSSSTISSCISHLLNPPREQGPQTEPPPRLDIHVLESRPLFEGVKAAQSIASLIQDKAPSGSSSSVSLFTDAAAAIAATDVDIVLMGADLIDRAGNVSNKTGSLPAVLSAKHVSPKAKVVVLSEKEKVLPFDPPGHEENDPEEVVQGWGDAATPALPGVHVKNVYFEWVDAGLIDHYVTEEGIETSEGIAQWAEEVKRKADGFFEETQATTP